MDTGLVNDLVQIFYFFLWTGWGIGQALATPQNVFLGHRPLYEEDQEQVGYQAFHLPAA